MGVLFNPINLCHIQGNTEVTWSAIPNPWKLLHYVIVNLQKITCLKLRFQIRASRSCQSPGGNSMRKNYFTNQIPFTSVINTCNETEAQMRIFESENQAVYWTTCWQKLFLETGTSTLWISENTGREIVPLIARLEQYPGPENQDLISLVVV